MGSYNNITMKTEKVKGVMLDDKHMRAGDIQKKFQKRRRREDYNPPAVSRETIDIKTVFESEGVCFYIKPANKEVTEYFFYLHGGGYCKQITEKQWKFVYDMVEKTGYGAAVPIYPLAPEHSASDTFSMLMAAYSKICHDESLQRIVLVGYEAGAGLALSMAILAWKGGYRRPNKLMLVTPVLDTEFLDMDLEQSLYNRKLQSYQYYFTPEIKTFLRLYWVKNLVGKVEYTSPIYADLTDICDEMDIFTITDDLMNTYARRLYEKVKQQQIKSHYYEFYSVVHNFIEHPYSPESRQVIRKIEESLMNENQKVNTEIVHSVWGRTVLAQRYPKLYSDNETIKLAEKLSVLHKQINAQYCTYAKAVIMERTVVMDERVRQFIMRYADGIIVNVGAEFDTMFSRVDNGRIRWYNIDLPETIEQRRKYMELHDREKNIDKSIFDLSWLEQIKKEQNQAILFVCCDVMKYFDKNSLKELLNAIWIRFPGAEIVFDVKNSVGKRLWNRMLHKGKAYGTHVNISIDNCKSLFYDWNIKYKVLYDHAILRYNDLEYMFSREVADRYKHAIKRKYDKVIHLRLGTEHFIDKI